MKNKKKGKIKAIIFDIGGVLKIPKTQNDNQELQGFHELIAKKLHLDFDTWFDAIDVYYAQSIVGKVSKNEFIQIASKRLGINKNKLEKTIIQCYKSKMKKNIFLYNLAEKAKKQKIITAILSDQWPYSKSGVFPKKDEKNFDIIIISYEVKMRKPNLEIYDLLLKKIKNKNKQIKNSEIIYIDDRSYNLEPAKKHGIKTILFRNNEQVKKELKKFNFI